MRLFTDFQFFLQVVLIMEIQVLSQYKAFYLKCRVEGHSKFKINFKQSLLDSKQGYQDQRGTEIRNLHIKLDRKSHSKYVFYSSNKFLTFLVLPWNSLTTRNFCLAVYKLSILFVDSFNDGDSPIKHFTLSAELPDILSFL